MRATATPTRRSADSPAAVGITSPAASVRPSPTIPASVAATIAAAPAAANGTAASAVAGNGSCPACWGVGAPTFTQALSTVINHLFNSTFDVLSTLPGGPISDLLTGALALVRRSLFFVPEGVTASQTANGLSIDVNTGSVAYFRQDGTFVQVSGDPLFLGAKPFTLTADQQVTVTNPGNAGCAGFVFTSGTAMGSLATTQIDAIRFEGDSAFDGSVDATVIGQPLTLRDAVRGGNGVTIDAAVVLANDVEIDAGGPGAHFTGAIDGAKKGKQSLTVTALKATVFDAPIGGVTPLASLVTQGIEPLVIAKSGDTKTIPLHFLPELSTAPPTDASPGVKYGIDVAIGDNPSQVYEFDTGGTGLFAGYNQPLWVGVPLTTTPASEVYNSGNYFDGVVSNTRVTLGQGDQTVSTAQPIAIGAILAGGNSKTNTTFTFTDPAAPPVEGRFFGDFGASFNVNNGLTSPLVQLPGNLANGFVVQLGPIGVTPQLTVGITEELRSQFPYAVPVILSPKGGTYPTSGLDILDQFGFAPTYTVALGTESHVLGTGTPLNITCQTSDPCLPTLIDSGAPASGIRLGEDSVAYFATPNGKQLKPGTTFTATFPSTPDRPDPLIWEFTAGDISSVDLVTYEKTQKVNNPENVNAALTLYNSFDVMFDVAGQQIYLRPTGGQATVTLNSVATTGSQTYRQNAVLAGTYTTEGGAFSVAGVTTLDGDTSIDTKVGDVTFSGTVDGASTLSVNSSGATNFVRVVGSQTPLTSVTTDAGGSTTTAGAITSGDQTYGDAVSLSGVFSVEQGTFSVAGPATLAGPVAVSGGDILFGGSIDSQAGKGYQLGLTPGDQKTANLTGAVGETNPLGGMQLSATGSGSATVNVNSSLTLLGNLGYSAETGVKIGDGVSASFTGGALIQSFTGAGVIVDGAAPLTISQFRLAGNGKEGIQVKNTSAVNILGNVIVGNGTSGINLDTVKDAVIGSNTISNNGADGIILKDSKKVTVTANSVNSNSSDGIEVRKGDENSIVGNTITANRGNGVFLDAASQVSVVDNVISGNGLSVSSKTVADGGTFYGNGIYALNAANIAIQANTIVGNGLNAVAPDAGNSTTVYANGVHLDGSANVSITEGNTITGNGTTTAAANLTVLGDGVLSDKSTPVQIEDNIISGNFSDGVAVKAADDNAILSNSIFGNGGKGISLSNGNDDQPAPQVKSAVLGGDNTLVVSGTIEPLIGYMDGFELQVFYSPSTDSANVQGRQLIYTTSDAAAGPFSYQISAPPGVTAGGFITATATPTTGASNTSKFSDSATIAVGF